MTVRESSATRVTIELQLKYDFGQHMFDLIKGYLERGEYFAAMHTCMLHGEYS